MATATLLRDKLDGEAKVAATIQSAIRSKDRDALRTAMAKATEVGRCAMGRVVTF
jgi:hypothetical protein